MLKASVTQFVFENLDERKHHRMVSLLSLRENTLQRRYSQNHKKFNLYRENQNIHIAHFHLKIEFI